MKKPVELSLTTIHLGNARRVVTLGINGKDPAVEFLSKLLNDDRNQFDAIRSRIKTIANYPRYENKLTFRNVGVGIHEFKRPGLRLYAFYWDLEGESHLIICTNGGLKNKDQSRDIARAKAIKETFLAAVENPDTVLNIDFPEP